MTHEVRCPCGSVAECEEGEDGCYRGLCRNGHEVVEVPEGCRPEQHPMGYCPTCED
jgi:hypothetical protein